MGKLTPRKTPHGDDDATARNKLLACIFLDGTDDHRYGGVITELSNQHLTGNGNTPERMDRKQALHNRAMEISDATSVGKRDTPGRIAPMRATSTMIATVRAALEPAIISVRRLAGQAKHGWIGSPEMEMDKPVEAFH
jgi:hypothetical protein